jgi:hypothetical protein
MERPDPASIHGIDFLDGHGKGMTSFSTTNS